MIALRAAFLALLCVFGARFDANTENRTPQDPAASHFAAFDVFVDCGTKRLGAYQFEWKVRAGQASIVGVEGGAHAAFRDAPYYDRAALRKARILVGAFSTAAELPTGRTRVARIHMELRGKAEPTFDVVLQACAGPDGKDIEAEVSHERTE